MNYVEHLNLLGVDVKEIPCITGKGAPTTATEGAVGLFYMDTDNEYVYKCIAVTNGAYIWKVLDDSSPTDEKYFDIDYDGIVSLKPEYRGHPTDDKYPCAISDNGVGADGSKINELPERIIIPEIINDTAVSGFQQGTFRYNFRVKEIVLPNSVGELPDDFCANARYLRVIKNTAHIKKLGMEALMKTRIREAFFPNLEEVGEAPFCQCPFLYTIDIGDKLKVISVDFAYRAIKLSCVKGGAGVTTIESSAFYNTFNLKNLPLLSNSNLTSIGKNAFSCSRLQFDWSALTNCTMGTNATPIVDNTTDYWSGYSPVACENRLVSLFNQKNPEWGTMTFGTFNRKYEDGCAFVAIAHIHSALTNKHYDSPVEFEEDIRQINPLLLEKDPADTNNAVTLLEGLGYATTFITANITSDTYREICEALADGAYVYVCKTTTSNVNGGHAVILYGINGIGEVLVADSDTGTNSVNIYDEGLTYRVPLQNITGPSSDFIIVRNTETL